ncbi:hypothetical protein JCM8547_008883 [Rhodosporidiobolus lusitaniae]
MPSPTGEYFAVPRTPTSPSFRRKDSSESLDSADSSGGGNGGFPPRPNSRQRRKSPLASRVRHLLLGKYARVVLAVAVLLGLHQLAFPSHRPPPGPSGKLSYFTPEPAAYREKVDQTLAKVGLSWSKTTNDPFVAALEKRLASPPLPPYKYLVGTMQHNEARDILEWLFYHISQGFDHFVVYDHFSTDETKEILAPLVDLGWVTWITFNQEGKYAQSSAFEKFAAEWALQSKWLFFFDADEFVVRNETLLPQSELDEPFADWFDRKYGSFGGVALPRLSFTSNGHYTPPAEGTLASYTEAREIDRNFFVPKIISQLRYKKRGGDIHKQEYEENWLLADPLGRTGGEMWKGRDTEGGYPLYMHHYWAKSWEECVGKIKQTAFPGSWREQMGDKFCRLEMPHTQDHSELSHSHYYNLAKLAPSLRIVIDRFLEHYPTFSQPDYTLSVLIPSTLSTKRIPATPADIQPGATLVVDYARNPTGFIGVVLTTKDMKRFLPVTYRSDGGASFTLPSLDSLSASSKSGFGSGFFELTVTLQHATQHDGEQDPPSPCTVMGHLQNRPEVQQLQDLDAGACKGVDGPWIWSLAQKTWPHSHYRGDTLFRRFFKVAASPSPLTPSSHSPTSAPPRSPSSLSVSALGTGRWQRTSLWQYPGHNGEPAPSVLPRLYTTGRCPRRFAPEYWDPYCHNDTLLASDGGVLRWVPDGATSYTDYSLSNEEVQSCLSFGPGMGGQPKRVLIAGDSVASHTYFALGCLLDQVGGVPNGRLEEVLRFRSMQYESFTVTTAGGLEGPTKEDWAEWISWDYDKRAGGVKAWPDVVVLNVGLWPVSWGTTEGYEKGMRESFAMLKELVKGKGTKLVWRETTAVFPYLPDGNGDPLYQVNPRVELFNRIANRLANEAGIPRFAAYEMTAPRRDAARDNAHICPAVQGDMAEMLLYGLCRGGLV